MNNKISQRLWNIDTNSVLNKNNIMKLMEFVTDCDSVAGPSTFKSMKNEEVDVALL
jgi:hypothetical protein